MLAVLLVLQLSAGGEDPTAADDEQAPVPALHEVVVVTASAQQQKLVDAVAPVSVVTRRDLAHSPNLALDTRLRQVPGFSLFRRASSLAAHPTTQGVSLRGLGSSGASRSLVLLDGVPLNDAFGGWVYWNRIPTGLVDSVEVVRGATSQLYGSSAMAGAIQLLSRVPEEAFVDLAGRGGSRDTWDLDAAAGGRAGTWAYLAGARAFDTDGYFLLRPADRGSVDVPAAVSGQAAYARAAHRGFHVATHAYWERREAGTQIQTNDSRLLAGDAGYAGTRWRAIVYLQDARLRSRFSRVEPGRASEALTADQDFPSWALGAAVSGQPADGVLVGADWRRAAWGAYDQNLAGLYVQKLARLGPDWEVLVGLRADLWENESAQASLSPRAGVVYRPSTSATLRATGYRGFRAPTLNELFRPFRVGEAETLANPLLDDERLVGAELGADFYPSAALLLRANGFWNRLDGAVGNVTLAAGPAGTLRQRQNLGRTTVRGVEADATLRWATRWWARAGYLFSASKVEETGLQLPQSPRHQATFALGFDGPPRLSLQGRWLGNQFEDDLNELPLGTAVVIDASAGVPLTARLEITLFVENLLDRDNVVGRVPLEQLDVPRTILAGLRFR